MATRIRIACLSAGVGFALYAGIAAAQQSAEPLPLQPMSPAPTAMTAGLPGSAGGCAVPAGCCPYGDDIGCGPCGSGGACGSGCEFPCASGQGCGQACPTWTIRAETIALDREGRRTRDLVTNGSGDAVLRTRDLGFDYGWGPKISIIRRDPCRLDWEVAYYGVDSWTSSHQVAGTDLQFSDAGVTALGGAGMQFRYESSLHSFEINARRPISCDLTLLAGFRWLEVHEEMTGGFLDSNTVFWTNDVDNHVYIFQLGAEAALWRCGNFTLEGMLKAGVGGTQGDQVSTSPALGRSAQAKRSGTSFLGETGIFAVYRFNRCIAARGGYQVLWLEGLALSPDQLDNTDLADETASVDLDGGLFYHGASLGLEFCF